MLLLGVVRDHQSIESFLPNVIMTIRFVELRYLPGTCSELLLSNMNIPILIEACLGGGESAHNKMNSQPKEYTG
jgi:hypothetical protein